MRRSDGLAIVAILVAISSLAIYQPGMSSMPGNVKSLAAPSSPTTLQVLSPTYGSNITDLSLVAGQQFTVNIVSGYSGNLTLFDVTLQFGTTGFLPTPISTASNLVSLAGGLFDPNSAPNPCTIATLANQVQGSLHFVRVSAVVVGGCQVHGTGTLFSVTFNVDQVGSTSLDILQASSGCSGTLCQLLIGGPTGTAVIPNVQVSGAVFRNKQGVAPVASFTYTPPFPVVRGTVKLNGTLSYDPYNQTGPDKGIKTFIWDFGDATPQVIGTAANASVTNHVFLITQTVFGAGYFQVRLYVIDWNNGLQSVQTQIVFINPGLVFDAGLSVSADKTSVSIGQSVTATVDVANRGNQFIFVGLNTTLDFQGTTILQPTSGGNDKNFSMPQSSALAVFKYVIDTSNLTARVYTINVSAKLLGNLTDANPADNTQSVSFTVLPSSPGGNTSGLLSLPNLAVGGIVAAIAAILAAQLLRRRRRAKIASEESLSQ